MDTNGTNQDNQPVPTEPAVPPAAPVETPTPDPVTPAEAPTPSQQPSAPTSQPPQKSNKGLVIGLSVGGGVFLLAIIAAVIYFAVFYVSKDHFKAAASQTSSVKVVLNKLDSASTDYGDAVTDADATDSEISSEKGDYEKAVDEYKASVKQLDGERALRDSEAKRLYDAFATKNREYMDYNDTMAASVPTLRTMTKKCDSGALGEVDSSKLDQLVSQYDAAISECKTAIADLTKAQNSDAAKVGKAVEGALAKMRAAVVDMQAAYKANDESAFVRAYSKISEISQEFSSSSDMQAVKNHEKELNPGEALTKLQNYLASKA